MKTVAALAIALLFVAPGASSAQIADELSRRQALERYRVGQELLTAERYEQAAAEFTAAIELDPLLTLAHYGLGQSYMALKRYASAVQAFTGCKDAYARIATLSQSNALESARRQDEEIRILRDFITAAMQGNIKGANEGNIAPQQKRLDELETMRRGTTVGARFQIPAEVLLALGSAHYRNGQAADAEREWAAAVTTNPRLGEAHNNLAVLYMQTGRKQQAEDAIRAAERASFRVHPQLKADIAKMK